jgi:hypothetical protein
MATRYDAVLSVSRNELGFSNSIPTQYVGCVNSSSFYGADKGYCMCTGITAQQQTFTDQLGDQFIYSAVTYNFAFRNQTSWQALVYNAGYAEKDSSGKLQNILTNTGVPVSFPWGLDNDGHKFPTDGSSDPDPIFLPFSIYYEADFSSLGL